MKFSFLVIWTFLLLSVDPPATHAQGNPIQQYDGNIILPSTFEDLICLGNWNAELERCEGSAVSSGALAAISAAKSADRLEQIRLLLNSINNKLSENTQALIDLRNAFDLQGAPTTQSLREAIITRFEAVPSGILTEDSVKEELDRLRNDILGEVERRNLTPPRSSGE
ncbi:hypothetical protein [Candidatus Manganitrophus noduliformans]|uniref:Secreted protein n=1 Tax=Candidatus Manganitrophus noduliformans TaxID=2606439 RepID=A0A7X6DTS3_9BACT|nr:hypothetical protein [Candidatus Manganitrophus noduliformans]NKE73243.1 hypothetical protein [Candidatus Manganitrophus noduliformans]